MPATDVQVGVEPDLVDHVAFDGQQLRAAVALHDDAAAAGPVDRVAADDRGEDALAERDAVARVPSGRAGCTRRTR